MTPHHLGLREVVSLAMILLCSKLFLAMPQQLATSAATAAWMLPLIAAPYAPVIWLSVRSVVRASPGGTLVEGTEAILGPWFGTLVNLCYALYFLLLVATVSLEFALDVRMLFLPSTPTVVIGLVILGTAAFLVYAGIEALGRVAALFGPPILIGLLLLQVGGVITHLDPDAIFPFWGRGALPLLFTGLSLGALQGEILFLGLIASAVRAAPQLDRAAWISIGASLLFMVLVMLTLLSVFPYPSLSHIAFPLLQMSQIVSVGPTAQRMESLFLLVWMIALLIKVGCALYGTVSILARTLRIPHVRWLIFPTVWLVNAITSLPFDDQTVATFDLFGLRIYGSIIMVGLPVITALVGWFRQRRRPVHG